MACLVNKPPVFLTSAVHDLTWRGPGSILRSHEEKVFKSLVKYRHVPYIVKEGKKIMMNKEKDMIQDEDLNEVAGGDLQEEDKEWV